MADSHNTTHRQVSRREAGAAIGGAALALVATGTAMPTQAAAHDPIFDAIERYKAGYAFHGQCLDKAGALEQIIFDKWNEFDADLKERSAEVVPQMLTVLQDKGAVPATWDNAYALLQRVGRKQIEQENDYAEMERLREEGSHAERDAMSGLVRTVPTTAAGAAALLAMMRDAVEGGDSIHDLLLSDDEELGALLTSLETFCRAA